MGGPPDRSIPGGSSSTETAFGRRRRVPSGLKTGEASTLLEEIRHGWVDDINDVVGAVESERRIVDGDARPDFEALLAGTARGMDSQAGWRDPPFSKRLDAQLRTRVYLHARSLVDGDEHYDPTSKKKKKKNDGIDLDMLQYLAAPTAEILGQVLHRHMITAPERYPVEF